MTLRPAGAADLPFVAGLLNRPENLDRLGGWDIPALAAALTDPDQRLWLWRVGTSPAGMLWLRGATSARPKIEEFAVDRPGTGCGSALLGAVLSTLPGKTVCLNVAEDNLAAQRFYTRHGFAVCDRADTLWQRRRGDRCARGPVDAAG